MEFKSELDSYSLYSLKAMEVIDINTGTRLGNIRDFIVDCENYKIEALIIPGSKASWFNKESVYEIKWDKIHKIGVDVILVDGNEIIGE